MSGRLMVNFCSSLMMLYIQSTCNTYISASDSVIGCVVVGVLGHWLFLAMLTSLAVYAVWLYVKLVQIFSKELPHYVIKAVLVTWGECRCKSGVALHNHRPIIFPFMSLMHFH